MGLYVMTKRDQLRSAICLATIAIGAFSTSATAEKPSIDLIKRMADPRNEEHYYADLMADRPGAVAAISEAIRSGDQSTKLYALRLAETDDFFSPGYFDLIKTLHRDPDQKIRYRIIGLLTRYGDNGKKILLEMLMDKSNEPNTRGVVLDFLNRLQSPAENAESARELLLAEKDELLRLRAAEALIRHKVDREIAADVARKCIKTCRGARRHEAIALIGVSGKKADLAMLNSLRVGEAANPTTTLHSYVRDSIRRLELELLPTPQEKIAHLRTIAADKKGRSKLWAVAILDLMAKDGVDGAKQLLDEIALDTAHPSYDFARGRGYGRK